MQYFYLIPIILAIVIGMYQFLILYVQGQKRMMDRPFKYQISNELYHLSYIKPFSVFINPNQEDKQVVKIEKMIKDANKAEYFNYRVLSMVQILLAILAIIGTLLFSFVSGYCSTLLKFLFNIELSTNSADMLQLNIIVGAILISLCLIPKLYLRYKAKKNNFQFFNNLPLLQLFIILMLKARRPLSEVLYILSKTNTVYRQIFESGYRIYVRDKEDGMKYLINNFSETRFSETIQVIFDSVEYSRDETIAVLQNGLQDITEYTNTLKRRKDINEKVISQFSMIFPFGSALLLIFAPIIAYGLSNMSL